MEKKKYQKISIFAKKNQWIVDSTSRSFPHSWLITGFVTRLTRWVSLVEQSLLTLTEHLSSHPPFSGVRINRSLDIMYVLYIVVCPFVFFLLVIMLSILLRYTDSDYPFGIFKLFFQL